MDRKKQLNITSLITALLLSSGTNADKLDIKPFFNSDSKTGVFFEKRPELNSANDFLALQEKAWEFDGADLEHKKTGNKKTGNKKTGNKKATNCKTLNKLLKEGYTVVKVYEYKVVSARSVICSMWKEMASFKPYSISFMNNLSLNKKFAIKAPARFALLISNEEIKKAESADSWNSMSQIKKVEPVSDVQAIYNDDSGGTQKLTLMAKGDYNGDGIEDWLLHMANSVEGGSYSSTILYIITRTTADGPISLLKEI
ncbi:hypothetical protein MNBD_GAMMA10-1717 [hydrothermal vent metagenome]|uniref:Uncharacterized protein n=1 Tax=hydrothermal vent metagenome TaxID=652676 RepID=A0A3B0XLD4_9ZZZZ